MMWTMMTKSFNIILSAIISADGNYSGTDVEDVSGINQDDDTAGVHCNAFR